MNIYKSVYQKKRLFLKNAVFSFRTSKLNTSLYELLHARDLNSRAQHEKLWP